MARFPVRSLLLIFLIGLAYISAVVIPKELSAISDTVAHEPENAVAAELDVSKPALVAMNMWTF